jgi:hypothetical protein
VSYPLNATNPSNVILFGGFLPTTSEELDKWLLVQLEKIGKLGTAEQSFFISV